VRGETAPTPLPTMAPARSTIPSGTIPPIPRMSPVPAPVPTAPIEPLPTPQQASKPTDIPAQKPAPAPVAVIPASQATPEIAAEKQARDPGPPVPQVRTEVSLPPAMPAFASVPESKPEPPFISPVKPPETPTVPTTPSDTNRNHHQSESATLDTLRRMCARFHLVARQLRLRKEYRPTLEITDEYDLQDLFYALLRLQFDEVGDGRMDSALCRRCSPDELSPRLGKNGGGGQTDSVRIDEQRHRRADRHRQSPLLRASERSHVGVLHLRS
jgi:hypothetical protein